MDAFIVLKGVISKRNKFTFRASWGIAPKLTSVPSMTGSVELCVGNCTEHTMGKSEIICS